MITIDVRVTPNRYRDHLQLEMDLEMRSARVTEKRTPESGVLHWPVVPIRSRRELESLVQRIETTGVLDSISAAYRWDHIPNGGMDWVGSDAASEPEARLAVLIGEATVV